jgi:phosphatidylglycerol:prolipoprotein diacylglycerol transferase
MRPILLEWGALSLPSYVTLLSLGVTALLWLAPSTARREGMPAGRVAALLGLLVVLGLVGARGLFVLEHHRILANPWTAALSLAPGGLASHGAFLLALPVGFVLARRLELSPAAVADSSAVGICVMGCLGRLGCFLAGCCYGRPTSLPWGVVFPETSEAASRWGFGVPVHPTQIYESVYLLAIAVVLRGALSRKRFEGEVFLTLVLFYSVARVFNDVLRGDSLDSIFGHGPASWMSLALLLTAAVVWLATTSSLTTRRLRA